MKGCEKLAERSISSFWRAYVAIERRQALQNGEKSTQREKRVAEELTPHVERKLLSSVISDVGARDPSLLGLGRIGELSFDFHLGLLVFKDAHALLDVNVRHANGKRDGICGKLDMVSQLAGR